MSLFSRLAAALRQMQPEAPAPSVLRNKPGGAAFIRIQEEVSGASALNGRVVITQAVRAGFWTIDPPQEFVLRGLTLTDNGRIGRAGDVVITTSMHDDCLEPIPDTGITDDEVADLYAPTAPERTLA